MKILNIEASGRGSESQSSLLGKAIVEKIKTTYPGSVVKNINLTQTLYPHMEALNLAAFYTPDELLSPDLVEAARFSRIAIDELLESDIIVISTPIYNFGIPSALKAWIDHIVKAGKTFRFENGALQGLLTAKKVYLAISSGFIFSEGDFKPLDFTEPYLKAFFNFMGVTEIETFRSEGSALEPKESIVAKALQSVENHLF